MAKMAGNRILCGGFAGALLVAALGANAAGNLPDAPAVSRATLTEDLARITNWFGGEWNNNEQVWQQKIDIDAAKAASKEATKDTTDVDIIPHTHHIFAPVNAPKIGAHIFYVQQSLGPDFVTPYRQRIYSFSVDVAEAAIRLDIFTPNDEKAFINAHLRPEQFVALDASSLKSRPGCEVYWRYLPKANEYTGTMKAGACNFMSERLGKRIVIGDTLKLSESELWVNDQARDEAGNYVFGSKTNTPIKARKVRYFSGWIYIKHAGKDAKPTDTISSFQRNVLLHTEGRKIPVMYNDGTPSPYVAEMALLTYQNTKTAILKLALLDKVTNKSVTYIWANPDAKQIGMNLGWFQMGFTQKKDRTQYSFGDPPVATSPKQ